MAASNTIKVAATISLARSDFAASHSAFAAESKGVPEVDRAPLIPMEHSPVEARIGAVTHSPDAMPAIKNDI